MHKIKVVKAKQVINKKGKHFEKLKNKIVETVKDVMLGIKESLAEEMEGIGLLVMETIMEEEIESLAGERYKHSPDREYTRHGTNPGSLIINGKKKKYDVTRVVAVKSKKAYSLKTYNLFHKPAELIHKAYRDLIRGISTRKYEEGVSEFLEGYGTSSSSVSRRMIAATTQKVQELFERRLEQLELAVLMIDGICVGDYTVVIALGIDIKGVKHILGVWEGSAENTTVAKGLLENLIDRGLNAEQLYLVVMDGSKSLRRAVSDILGTRTPIQRCVVHKKRNVLGYLPKNLQGSVSRRMTEAYSMNDATKAKERLLSIAQDLEREYSSAANSLREGLDETLTLHRLNIPLVLRKTLQSTNLIESLNSVVRQNERNVKNWQSENQAKRWACAGVLEAEKGFRRIKGYGAMPILINELDKIKKQSLLVA